VAAIAAMRGFSGESGECPIMKDKVPSLAPGTPPWTS
jgi:hypothetical protein